MQQLDLFSWTYRDGTNCTGDALPEDDDIRASITELVFNRNKERFVKDGIRDHLSHPIHEQMLQGGLPENLTVLRAEGCKLRSFPVLPTSIIEIYMSGNNLLALPDLSMFHNLIVLELADNSISAISNPLPPVLVRLNLSINALRSFDLQLLQQFDIRPDIFTHSNPYNPFPQVLVRPAVPTVANQPVRPAVPTVANQPMTVFESTQSVHASGVQSSVKNNILWIKSYRPDVPINIEKTLKEIEYVPWHKWLFGTKPNTKAGKVLRNYCEHSYAMHGITISNLVDRLWLRIQDLKDKEQRMQLIQRLFEEVADGDGHCTNGMMSRLANVFIGFDENCKLCLSPNEVLSARVPATMFRLRKSMQLTEGDESAAFFLAVYNETIKDLMELEVSEDEWHTWLEPMSTMVLDELWDSKPIWKTHTKHDRPEENVLATIIKSEAELSGFDWEIAYIINKWR